MKNVRLIAGSAAMTAVAAGLMLLPGTSASAATPSCTKRVLFSTNGAGFAYVPMNAGETTTRCSLSQGASNQGVKALQEMINDCYIAKGRISASTLSEDGSFGNNTYSALRKVQDYMNVGVDGQYGPQTASKIQAKADSGSCADFPAN